MNKLSVIIITKNEADKITRCLQSVQWADEIIVLDSGSDDDTMALAKQFTPHVFATDWPGFGKQKQRALDKATGDWVLSLDADEWLPEDAQKTVQQLVQQNENVDGYWLKRNSYFCGRLMLHGLWNNDWVLRLFKRTTGQFEDKAVHEKLIVSGTVEKIKAIILHDPCQTMAQAKAKDYYYAKLQAPSILARNKSTSHFSMLSHSIFSFIKGYFFRAGFLDGKQGLWLAFSHARYTYLKYYFAKQLKA